MGKARRRLRCPKQLRRQGPQREHRARLKPAGTWGRAHDPGSPRRASRAERTGRSPGGDLQPDARWCPLGRMPAPRRQPWPRIGRSCHAVGAPPRSTVRAIRSCASVKASHSRFRSRTGASRSSLGCSCSRSGWYSLAPDLSACPAPGAPALSAAGGSGARCKRRSCRRCPPIWVGWRSRSHTDPPKVQPLAATSTTCSCRSGQGGRDPRRRLRTRARSARSRGADALHAPGLYPGRDGAACGARARGRNPVRSGRRAFRHGRGGRL